MWKAQQVELSSDKQKKDEQREKDEALGKTRRCCAATGFWRICAPILPSCISSASAPAEA